MKTRQVMTRFVLTVDPRDALDRAARIMSGRRCGCLPVVEEGQRLVGILTDRDICMTAARRGLALNALQVQDAMRTPVFSCEPETHVEDALALMVRHRVRRLPVIDPQGSLVGILSLDDVARHGELAGDEVAPALSPATVGRTLARILCSAEAEA